MTPQERQKWAEERLTAWLRSYEAEAANKRLEDATDDLACAIEDTRYCSECQQERNVRCPDCDLTWSAQPLFSALDAVKQEIETQVELFNMAS